MCDGVVVSPPCRVTKIVELRKKISETKSEKREELYLFFSFFQVRASPSTSRLKHWVSVFSPEKLVHVPHKKSWAQDVATTSTQVVCAHMSHPTCINWDYIPLVILVGRVGGFPLKINFKKQEWQLAVWDTGPNFCWISMWECHTTQMHWWLHHLEKSITQFQAQESSAPHVQPLTNLWNAKHRVSGSGLSHWCWIFSPSIQPEEKSKFLVDPAVKQCFLYVQSWFINQEFLQI